MMLNYLSMNAKPFTIAPTSVIIPLTDSGHITRERAVSPEFKLIKSGIFSIYNKARALARRSPDLVDVARLNKALGILQSKGYFADKDYTCTRQYCTCPDHKYRRPNCEHMLADWLLGLIFRYCQTGVVAAA